MKELIEYLKDKIVECKDEAQEDKSWVYQEGIIISVNEAKEIVEYFCVFCKSAPKSCGSDYCVECINNGNYLTNQTNKEE